MAKQRKTWIDHNGVRRRTLKNRLNFKGPTSRALRAFIHQRDNFTCQYCGISPNVIPDDYDGARGIWWEDNSFDIDHIIPWRDGGNAHPDNLQLLCSRCNTRKMRFERIWRENDRLGTPNDYVGWVKRYVPAGYADCTFIPDAFPLAGQGGVENAE